MYTFAVQPSQGGDVPGWFVPVLLVVCTGIAIFLAVVYFKKR